MTTRKNATESGAKGLRGIIFPTESVIDGDFMLSLFCSPIYYIHMKFLSVIKMIKF